MSDFLKLPRRRSWLLIILIAIISASLLALYAIRDTAPAMLSIKNPRWSPDGSWLLADCAFEFEWDGYAVYEVCLTKPDNSNLIRLAPEHAMSRSLQATWSPSGQQVAFVRPEGGLVIVAPPPGTKQTVIDISCDEPAWSPDERQIACAGSDNITVVDLSTGQVTNVTRPGNLLSPQWAQQGQALLFVRAGGVSHYYLYRLDLATQQEQRLVEMISPDHAISVAPDQEQVVYPNHDLTTLELLNLRTGIRSNVLGAYGTCFQDISAPAWSHDGQYLAFAAGMRPLDGQIYLLNVRTNEIFQLTHFQKVNARFLSPSTWSPDNSMLATTTQVLNNRALSQLAIIPTKTTGLAPVQC